MSCCNVAFFIVKSIRNTLKLNLRFCYEILARNIGITTEEVVRESCRELPNKI
jgi:hypothetical protein